MRHEHREDISGWASRIDTVIGNIESPVVRRVVVVESTRSTQDAAVEFAHARSGLLLVASSQTAGRGANGRSWIDADRCTLPCTFVVDPGCKDAPMLAACVACVVHETLSTMLGSGHDLKIKWPNDILARVGDQDRKLAGILIEQRAGLILVGIGINCTQLGNDWAPELQRTAVSLAELGSHVSRLDLICRLVEHMSEWFQACDRGAIREYFRMHDAMVGTIRTFRHNNTCYHGLVEHLDPLEHIMLDTPSGVHTLPIAQTAHLRGDEPCF